MSIDPITFVGGPYNGRCLTPNKLPDAQIGVPIDWYGRPSSQPMAMANYRATNNSRKYEFVGYFTQNLGFPIQFVGGPCEGTKRFGTPILELPAVHLEIMAASELGLGGEERIGGLAKYVRVDAGDSVVFQFQGFVEDSEKIALARDQVVNNVVEEEIRNHYVNQDDSIYAKKPDNTHAQVPVSVDHRRGKVDEGISDVIRLVWQLGLDTAGSCQQRPGSYSNPGRAYIQFWRERDAVECDSILSAALIEHELKRNSRGIVFRKNNGIELRFDYPAGSIHFLPHLIPEVIVAFQAEVDRRQLLSDS